jgi:hypothetical protein
MDYKKLIGVWGLAFVTGFYRVFVLRNLWNWFLVPTLHASEISFWQMYGLNMLVNLLIYVNDFAEEERWTIFSAVFEASVVDAQREAVREALKGESDQVWSRLGWKIAGRIGDYSFALGFGWVIRTIFL